MTKQIFKIQIFIFVLGMPRIGLEGFQGWKWTFILKKVDFIENKIKNRMGGPETDPAPREAESWEGSGKPST